MQCRGNASEGRSSAIRAYLTTSPLTFRAFPCRLRTKVSAAWSPASLPSTGNHLACDPRFFAKLSTLSRIFPVRPPSSPSGRRHSGLAISSQSNPSIHSLLIFPSIDLGRPRTPTSSGRDITADALGVWPSRPNFPSTEKSSCRSTRLAIVPSSQEGLVLRGMQLGRLVDW